MKIPVIINNRDLLTWPKAMVERIKRYEGVGDIWIIDNDSDYRPLWDWYETNPCTVIKTNTNFGHRGAWDSKIVKYITQDSEYYVVTDSDLGLENTPDDTLIHLKRRMDELNLDKIGLGLDYLEVKPESPYYPHMQNYEKPRWTNTKWHKDVALDVAIDTTFALYRVPHYFIGGASVTFPYIARHYPWEFTKETYLQNKEFQYYIENANNSSSYKWFINSQKAFQ